MRKKVQRKGTTTKINTNLSTRRKKGTGPMSVNYTASQSFRNVLSFSGQKLWRLFIKSWMVLYKCSKKQCSTFSMANLNLQIILSFLIGDVHQFILIVLFRKILAKIWLLVKCPSLLYTNTENILKSTSKDAIHSQF